MQSFTSIEQNFIRQSIWSLIIKTDFYDLIFITVKSSIHHLPFQYCHITHRIVMVLTEHLPFIPCACHLGFYEAWSQECHYFFSNSLHDFFICLHFTSLLHFRQNDKYQDNHSEMDKTKKQEKQSIKQSCYPHPFLAQNGFFCIWSDLLDDNFNASMNTPFQIRWFLWFQRICSCSHRRSPLRVTVFTHYTVFGYASRPPSIRNLNFDTRQATFDPIDPVRDAAERINIIAIEHCHLKDNTESTYTHDRCEVYSWKENVFWWNGVFYRE